MNLKRYKFPEIKNRRVSKAEKAVKIKKAAANPEFRLSGPAGNAAATNNIADLANAVNLEKTAYCG